ncbi:hypothetical protein KW444_11130 [Vibrio fluvialis]|nr:hypothetical protein [Vibrio fluvialis]
MSRGLIQCFFSGLCERASYSLLKVPVGSLVLAGVVLGVPDAENLKIRPEFFPDLWFQSYLVITSDDFSQWLRLIDVILMSVFNDINCDFNQ